MNLHLDGKDILNMINNVNNLKIAIHHRKGSFSERWIKYCLDKGIIYKLVNCYDSNIIEQIRDCNGFMWHWAHWCYKDIQFARQLIYSLEKIGIKVFPDSNTCWHFDDKVGQKYLLEAIEAPLVPSYVFYDEESAYEWIDKTTFPKVFKLRGGASSENVRLVRNKHEAKKIARRAFNKGYPYYSNKSSMRQKLWILKRDKNFKSFVNVTKGLMRFIIKNRNLELLPPQKGYVYFQDFIPENTFDDRIIVIGNRAIAIRRKVRLNDFRASGSGIKEYNPEIFPLKSIQIAFNISQLLKTQSIAFDFIYYNNKPLITEISYAYITGPTYDDCPGYWDRNLIWHNEKVNPQYFIIEDFINSLKE
jgi:hypothetical protein